jgi:hypothetical protein
VIGGDRDIIDPEGAQKLADQLLEVGRIKLAQLPEHLGLGCFVVLGGFRLDSAVTRPLRPPAIARRKALARALGLLRRELLELCLLDFG